MTNDSVDCKGVKRVCVHGKGKQQVSIQYTIQNQIITKTSSGITLKLASQTQAQKNEYEQNVFHFT